jgi:hypothetical protein
MSLLVLGFALSDVAGVVCTTRSSVVRGVRQSVVRIVQSPAFLPYLVSPVQEQGQI